MDLLTDRLNLQILESICRGEGISFNISQLSDKLNRHRSTIKKRIEKILTHKIIHEPICPFRYINIEYPLFVVVYADFPNYDLIADWIQTDPHLFAAYSIREEEYNIMLIEYHHSLTQYQKWREELIIQGKIPPRQNRRASTSFFFSNDLQIKNEPETTIKVLESQFKRTKKLEINGYKMDHLDLEILGCLLTGDGIKINENHLSKKLNSHRKTIENRINKLLENKVVQKPRCLFPQYFLASNLLLVYSLIDLTEFNTKFFEKIASDHHIPIIFKVSIGRYNLLLFSVHESIDAFLEWDIKYRETFPNTIGIEKIIYISPRMTRYVNIHKITMGVINKKLGEMPE
ncbi:MAG: hypothetical protein ACTSQI_04805 [Candidatus Helarchaeota archaeon]